MKTTNNANLTTFGIVKIRYIEAQTDEVTIIEAANMIEAARLIVALEDEGRIARRERDGAPAISVNQVLF